MEMITSDLEDCWNTKKKLRWNQNSKGEYILSKNSVNSSEKISERKTSVNVLKNEKEIIKIIDNSEKFKIDMTVMTEWGLGKILKITEGIALVKIEGTDIEFPLTNLGTMITLYFCILARDGTSWAEIKIPFDYHVYDLKLKIAKITNSHHSQIVLVHNGCKIEKNVNIFELGIYERDTFLVIIKDTQENELSRCKIYKTISLQGTYHAIRFKTNQNIILTGVGFLKNNMSDVSYQLLIFEEEPNSNLKLVFTQKQISVVSLTVKEENPIYKHKISNLEIKKDTFYEIHQYLNKIDSNQIIAAKCLEDIEDKSTRVVFSFSNCQIQGKENSTNIEEGMIPSIYYIVKSDN